MTTLFASPWICGSKTPVTTKTFLAAKWGGQPLFYLKGVYSTPPPDRKSWKSSISLLALLLHENQLGSLIIILSWSNTISSWTCHCPFSLPFHSALLLSYPWLQCGFWISFPGYLHPWRCFVLSKRRCLPPQPFGGRVPAAVSLREKYQLSPPTTTQTQQQKTFTLNRHISKSWKILTIPTLQNSWSTTRSGWKKARTRTPISSKRLVVNKYQSTSTLVAVIHVFLPMKSLVWVQEKFSYIAMWATWSLAMIWVSSLSSNSLWRCWMWSTSLWRDITTVELCMPLLRIKTWVY